MSRPLIPTGGNDKVMTPDYLAQQIVDYIKPTGTVLEPCAGGAAFIRALGQYGIDADWCELDKGKDFLILDIGANHYDWVITNPPFSLFRPFLRKSMEVSDNVVFLSLVNAWFMKARLRDIKEMGFGFKQIVFCDTPTKEHGWPQMGLALGAVHIQKDYVGDCKFNKLKD